MAAVERRATHPIAKAIVDRAELLNLTLPETRGQAVEPDRLCSSLDLSAVLLLTSFGIACPTPIRRRSCIF
ncbi:hypothetical protein V6N13_057940 [Hibiscus sabdariffa]